MRLWPTGGLWRHPDFVKLWSAETVSQFGTQFTQLALPLAAIDVLHASAFEDVMGAPAWRSLPTWYSVSTQDEAIPPDAERMFAQRMEASTVEVRASHVAMVSHPVEVARLIQTAAEECSS